MVALLLLAVRHWCRDAVSDRIAANLKTVVFRAGISYGGEEEWNHAWGVYKDSNVPSEKRKLLYALSMSTDSLRLNRLAHTRFIFSDV